MGTTDLGSPDVSILPDAERLADELANRFARLAAAQIKAQSVFRVALAGGSTPKRAYQRMAEPGYAARINWSRVHVFWGDERCVPPRHPASNYKMARESLLDHVPLPADQVHRIQGEIDPAAAAEAYRAELAAAFAEGSVAQSSDAPRVPRFDLILLGLGQDGHTASLFPGSAALSERLRWAVAHQGPEPDSWRVTLTYPVLNASANVIFLVSGEDKAEILARVLKPSTASRPLPAQQVLPAQGKLHWLVDRSAARLL